MWTSAWENDAQNMVQVPSHAYSNTHVTLSAADQRNDGTLTVTKLFTYLACQSQVCLMSPESR